MKKLGTITITIVVAVSCFLGVLDVMTENAKAMSWDIQIPDDSGATGKFTSIALDSNGYPHISYYRTVGSELKYARWDGSKWKVETVDSVNWVGYYTSIAVDSNDFPHISYYDNTIFALKYAKWNTSVWDIEIVDATGVTGKDSSIALDRNDNPHISYCKSSDDLGYARWNGTAWNIETVDTVGNVCQYTSIGLDNNDYPHISYQDFDNKNLKYARWTGTGWSVVTVDSGTWVGMYSSIALDSDDHPHIAHYDYDNERLRYAHWNGTTWIMEVVDPAIGVGWHPSIAIDKNDHPHIAYYDLSNHYLKYARWNGEMWNIEIVEGGASLGTYTSLALDAGDLSHISYYHSSWDSLKYAKGTRTEPWAPRNLQAVAGDSEMLLSWDPPLNDGGSPLSNYVVYRGTSLGGETFLVETSSVPGYSDIGLTNGQTYYYEVSAKNAIGEGPMSNEASGMPVGPPTAPLNPQGLPGDSQVSLSWDVPASDEGSPITNYSMYRGLTSGGEAFLVRIGDVLSYDDIGLTNGQPYYYRISASNAVGEGPLSEEVEATPVTIPTEPLNLAVEPGNSYVNLAWDPPNSDGGAQVTNYRIYRDLAPGGSTILVEVGEVLFYDDTSVTNGVTYYYRVSAVNSAGEGPYSDEVSGKPVGPPTAPRNLQATLGDQEVALSWDKPESDGGLVISGYRIYRGTETSQVDFVSGIGDVLTYTDTGLSNGQSYYYQVTAANSFGEGAFSNEVMAMPATVPEAPQNLNATSGNSYVNLTWSPPGFDGGSPITAYTVYRGTIPGGESWFADIGIVTYFNDTNVENGLTYYYITSARNLFGEGDLSVGASATPVNQLPTCAIERPSSGQEVSGTTMISGYANDLDGMLESVEIRIDDGDWIGANGTALWTYSWDSTEVSDGRHTVFSRSFDGENYSFEASVGVEVRNMETSIFEELWFWVLIVVLIIVVILVGVLFYRRRGDEKAETDQ